MTTIPTVIPAPLPDGVLTYAIEDANGATYLVVNSAMNVEVRYAELDAGVYVLHVEADGRHHLVANSHEDPAITAFALGEVLGSIEAAW